MRYAKFLKDTEWMQADVIVSDQPDKFKPSKAGERIPRIVSPYDVPGIYDLILGKAAE